MSRPVFCRKTQNSDRRKEKGDIYATRKKRPVRITENVA